MYMREREFCRCFSCDGILYEVRRGDTLYSISRRFEVALEDLMDANPFINVYRPEPGMQVCVPVRGQEQKQEQEQEDVCPYGLSADPMKYENSEW